MCAFRTTETTERQFVLRGHTGEIKSSRCSGPEHGNYKIVSNDTIVIAIHRVINEVKRETKEI